MRKPMEPFISADSLARTSKLGSLSADGVTLPFFMILEAHTHTHIQKLKVLKNSITKLHYYFFS